MAHYEFVWAHQLWNLTDEVEPYFQHYLNNYILPDGNFLYNTQDQVEAPLNVGVFLENSARAYDYRGDFDALQKRLPGGGTKWRVRLRFEKSFTADLIVHIHPPSGQPLKSASTGELRPGQVVLPASLLAGKMIIRMEII